MDFKIGDKVKNIKNTSATIYDFLVGKTGTVVESQENSDECVVAEFNTEYSNKARFAFYEGELELVQ